MSKYYNNDGNRCVSDKKFLFNKIYSHNLDIATDELEKKLLDIFRNYSNGLKNCTREKKIHVLLEDIHAVYAIYAKSSPQNIRN